MFLCLFLGELGWLYEFYFVKKYGDIAPVFVVTRSLELFGFALMNTFLIEPSHDLL